MNSKTGKIAILCCFVALIGVVVAAYAVLGIGRSAVSQDQAIQILTGAGSFKVGSALGEERGGFSGRPMVQVFVSADEKDWPVVSAALQSPEVEAEMGSFTGVLIDPKVEPQIEEGYRGQGIQALVRGLDGSFLGALPPGFGAINLAKLLNRIRVGSFRAIEKSPIYASLLRSPDAIDSLKAKGEIEKARRFVELLKELEGADSPAVLEAEARLNQ